MRWLRPVFCSAAVLMLAGALAFAQDVAPAPDLAATDCQIIRPVNVVVWACSDVITKHPEAAAAYAVRGEAQRQRGDLVEALKDLDKALVLDPNLAVAYAYRGRAYADKRLLGQATIDLERAVELDPRLYLAHNVRGNIALQGRDPDRAIADYTRAIDAKPDYAVALANRGRAWGAKKEYQKALADLDASISIDGSSAYALQERGVVHANKRDWDRAIEDYTKAIDFNPRYAIAYINRGRALHEKKDAERALADLNKAIELDSNSATAFNNRGAIHVSLKASNSAMVDFNRAIGLNPNYVLALVNRGKVHAERQDYERAIADFDKVIELDPAHTNARSLRGDAASKKAAREKLADAQKAVEAPPPAPPQVKAPWQIAMELVTSANAHAAKKDYDRALGDLGRALELDPKSSGAYAARALIHVERKDADKAIVDYTQALELNARAYEVKPKLVSLLVDRGRKHFDKKDFDRAIADVNQAMTIDPTAAHGHEIRGTAHLQKKNFMSAIADLSFAINGAPKSTDLYLNRGRAYDGKGDSQYAIADYAKVISLEPKMAAAYVLRAAAYAKLKDHVRAGADYRAALAIEPNNAAAKEGAKKVPDVESEKPRPELTDALMRVAVVRTAKADCEPGCQEWIAADGRIDGDTPALFKKVLKDLGGRKLPIFVHSAGGSVEAGLEIGRLIRAKGLDVFVTKTEIVPCAPADKACKRGPAKAVPKPHLALCASSCAFILAAGTRRYVGQSSLVGVHQIASYHTRYKVLRQYRIQTKMVDGKRVEVDRELVSEKRVDEETVRARTPDSTYARIKKFFTEMGIDDAIMPILISTPNGEMHWLTAAELETTRFVTDRLNGEQFIAGITTPVWTEADRAALREALEAQKAKAGAAVAAGSKLKPANKP